MFSSSSLFSQTETSSSNREAVFVLAPFGQDAFLLSETLKRFGLVATPLSAMTKAVERLGECAVLVITT